MVSVNMEGIRDRGMSYQAVIQCEDHTGAVVKKQSHLRSPSITHTLKQQVLHRMEN